MDNKKVFSYTYSAKEQEEIKAIRKKYSAPEKKEDKMTYLRRLDAGVTQKAAGAALAFGIVGTLILGFGMSLTMTEFWKILGISESVYMLVGIIIGVAGIVLVGVAYPLYNSILKKERKKIAHEVIRLTDELMK